MKVAGNFIFVSLLACLCAGCCVVDTEKPVSLGDGLFLVEWRSIFEECKNQDELHRKGKAEELSRLYRKKMIESPNDPIWDFLYGRLLGMMGKPEESIFFFRVALQKDPDFVWAHYAQGVYHLKKQDDFHARAHFSRCLLNVPDFAPALVGMARLLSEKETNLAIEYLTKAIEIMPQESSYYRHRGNLHFRAGQENEGEADLLAAYRLGPPTTGLLKDIAFLYLKRQQKKKAAPFLKALSDLLPPGEPKEKIRTLYEICED